jgi:hypothetical protein
MKTFATIAMIAAMALCGAIRADAAGSATTSSNIKNPSAETCDPKIDKNCVPPPPTRAVSGTISGTIEPRTAKTDAKTGAKASSARRPGDPVPDVDASLAKKSGAALAARTP